MIDRTEDNQLPAVPFVPFRCPRCGAVKPFTYGQEGRVRYHRCKFCEGKFRSVEITSREMRDWKGPPMP